MKTRKVLFRISFPLIVIVFLVAASLYNFISHQQWKAVPKDGTFIAVGTRRVFTKSEGSGPVTFLIENESGSSSAEWKYIRAVLAENCRVISYDRAGFGNSDPCFPKTIESVMSDLEAVIDYYKIDRFYGLGQGTGSLFLEYYAAKNPEKVMGLILCEPVTYEFSRIKKELPAVVFSNLFDRVPGLKIGRILAMTGIVRSLNAVPYENLPDDIRSDVVENYSSPHMYDAYIDELRKATKQAAAEISGLQAPDIPVIIVHHNSEAYRDKLITYYISWNQAEDIENLLMSLNQNALSRYNRGLIIQSAFATTNIYQNDPGIIIRAAHMLCEDTGSFR